MTENVCGFIGVEMISERESFTLYAEVILLPCPASRCPAGTVGLEIQSDPALQNGATEITAGSVEDTEDYGGWPAGSKRSRERGWAWMDVGFGYGVVINCGLRLSVHVT
ncbi:hypothetical protein E2C01_087562 [Portunus trituberculatus]|uniref:Uncharacterized protein n=1 Tax=Portunus trituberculatus TaxID=210409 RepID=A0A5B7J3P6_PORTR|nr:hypothetical protein [Portunus trituberculatus]